MNDELVTGNDDEVLLVINPGDVLSKKVFLSIDGKDFSGFTTKIVVVLHKSVLLDLK